MNKFENPDICDQRKMGVAVARQMIHAYIIVDEMAEQATLQPPLGIGRGVGCNVIEFRGHAIS